MSWHQIGQCSLLNLYILQLQKMLFFLVYSTHQLHAARSGHSNFSESTEEIKPLTEEEKKQQLEKYGLRFSSLCLKIGQATWVLDACILYKSGSHKFPLQCYIATAWSIQVNPVGSISVLESLVYIISPYCAFGIQKTLMDIATHIQLNLVNKDMNGLNWRGGGGCFCLVILLKRYDPTGYNNGSRKEKNRS